MYSSFELFAGPSLDGGSARYIHSILRQWEVSVRHRDEYQVFTRRVCSPLSTSSALADECLALITFTLVRTLPSDTIDYGVNSRFFYRLVRVQGPPLVTLATGCKLPGVD